MENSNYSSSEWYSQPVESHYSDSCSEWYSQNDIPSTDNTKKKRKVPRWIWVVGIILAILIALALAVNHLISTYTISNISDPNSNIMDDWQSYFNTYYNNDTITEAEYNMEKTTYTGNYSMTLDASDGEEISLQEIYKKCQPTTVYITAKTSGTTPSTSMGTGIIISSDGLIVTNAHIIDGAETAVVKLFDDSEYDATLIGGDSQSDLAVLKIDAENLTPAVFADSGKLEVGDEVVAIGNPLKSSLTGTMTNGIISAINRGVTYNGHSMTLIQTNAAINEGNSGGPLIDMCGRIIGITNMKMRSNYTTVEGIGFAIPSTTIMEVVNQFVSNGAITGRPSMGITVGPISQSNADYFDIPVGLYISAVVKGSDAELQGIQPGDILIKVNGKEVAVNSDVSSIRDQMSVGAKMDLTIWRDGEYKEFTITLKEMSDYYN